MSKKNTTLVKRQSADVSVLGGAKKGRIIQMERYITRSIRSERMERVSGQKCAERHYKNERVMDVT